ncbi:CoA-binding protein [Rhizobium ruizarguesonis]
MAPRSVAVVGATERADASSSYVMKNLMNFGYQGTIIPVHPKAEAVFGYRAAPSLRALDAAPDVAVIAIAADKVIAALEEAGSTGVKAAVVLASGFAELNEAGSERQRQLVEIAGRYGMERPASSAMSETCATPPPDTPTIATPGFTGRVFNVRHNVAVSMKPSMSGTSMMPVRRKKAR